MPHWLGLGRQDATARVPTSDADGYLALAQAAETMLLRDVLEKWFPVAIDPEGGFHQDFSRTWKRSKSAGARDLVYQARLTWTAAKAAERFPNHPANFAAAQRHGLDWLRHFQWDQAEGGFLWSVDRTGAPKGLWAWEKHSYGAAFGIYAAAACFRASGDKDALDLALSAFRWLETHALDLEHGGYREVVACANANAPAAAPAHDAIGTPYANKSANTHIHLLEAVTELYNATSHDSVRIRLLALREIVSRNLCPLPGQIAKVATNDWRALPGPESYGHAFEAAFLLYDAGMALHGRLDADAWKPVRALVDRALERGGDPAAGIDYQGDPEDRRKLWWTQAEALNALLLMHAAFGRQTPRYWTAFSRLWTFVLTKQRDARNGGWHPELRADQRPERRPKSDGWTDCYHQARSLLTICDRLRALARQPPR